MLLNSVLLTNILLTSHAYALGESSLVNTLTGVKAVEQEQPQPDPFGRDAPSGTVKGILKALASNDAELLQNFFEKKTKHPEDSLTELQLLLDRSASIATDIELSKADTGNLNDKLDSNLDRIGSFTLQGQSSDLLLKRVKRDGTWIWVLPNEFVQKISNNLEQTEPTVLDSMLGDSLEAFTVFDLSLGHIVATLVVAVVVFILGVLFGYALIFLLSRLWPRLRGRKLLFDKVLVVPLAFVFASEMFHYVANAIGISVNVREPANNFAQIVGWIAIAWLLMRLVDSVSRRAEKLSMRDGRTGNLSVISLLKRVAKAVVFISAVLVVLGNLGVDLSTGIAALGLGGLALALGAQKTVENFVGSVVVVADRPINVGDYCRFGATEGTVEDIGIRSTRIRTLARTLVTIPNGDFSSMEIENYSVRDRFLFNHEFAFALTSKKAQLEKVLFDMRLLMNENSFVDHEDARVRLRYAERDCFKIEVFVYILANNFAQFLEMQESLLLDIIKLIDIQEVDLAVPVQRMQVEQRIV